MGTTIDAGFRSLLTGREAIIVELIAEGQQSAEISTSLGISVRTVEVHRRNIMRKANARNLAELLRAVYTGRTGTRHQLSP
jgi:two-component system NarL family response regulator